MKWTASSIFFCWSLVLHGLPTYAQSSTDAVRQQINHDLQQFRQCPTNFFVSTCQQDWEAIHQIAQEKLPTDDPILTDLYLQTGKWIGSMDNSRWGEAVEFFEKGIQNSRIHKQSALQFELQWQQCNAYLLMNQAGRSRTCYDNMTQDSSLTLLQQQAILIGKMNAVPIRDRQQLIKDWFTCTTPLADTVRLSGKQLGNLTGTIGLKRLRLRFEALSPGQTQERMQAAENMYQVAKDFYGSRHPEMAIYLLQKAQALRQDGQLLEAIATGHQAFDLLASNVPDQPLGYYAKIARLLGNCYDQLGDLGSALQQFREAARRSQAYEGLHHIETAANLFNVGHVLFRLGDFESAQAYFLQAKQSFEGKLGPKHPFVGRCYQNLAAVCEQMGQDSLHLAYLQQSLDIHALHAPASPAYAMTLSNVGLALHRQQKPAEAGYALLQARELIQDHTNAVYAHFIVLKNLGLFYEHEGRKKEAIDLYQQALSQSAGQASPTPAERSDLWMQMAKVYRQTGQWNQAVEANEQALLVLGIHDSVQAWLNADPQLEVFPVQVPISLGQLAESLLHRYRQLGTLADLHRSRQAFKKSFAYLDLLQQQWESPDSYRILNEAFHQLFESAIEAEYLAFQEMQDSSASWQALIYSEQSRASRLRQAWKTQHAGSMVGEQINQQLHFLRAKIIHLNARLKSQEAEVSDSVKQNWGEQIFLAKRTKDSLLREVANVNPVYHQLAFQPFPAQRGDLLPEAIPSQAYLEFFWGKRSTYRFFVNQGEILFSQLQRRDSLNLVLNHLKAWWTDDQLIEAQARNPKVLTSFASYSHAAYALLMDSLLLPRSLCIVPDGPLHQFPMGLLLPSVNADSMGSYSELSYLIKHHVVSFRYSLIGQPYIRQRSSSRIAAFAPEDESSEGKWSLRDGTMQPLPYSIEEVQQLHHWFGGKIFVGDAATEPVFHEQASSFDILHLAMHAEVNLDDPMSSRLLFYPTEEASPLEGALHIHEITQRPLSNQMVVLSGCGTGTGQWEKGEGVISLSWAFQHAGSASVLASFWPVNDRSTALLMVQYYQLLKQGLSKDAALQQAQLQLIQSAEFNHPFYWAAWHLSGDSNAISLDKDQSNLMWIGLLMFVLAGISVWRIRPGARIIAHS